MHQRHGYARFVAAAACAALLFACTKEQRLNRDQPMPETMRAPTGVGGETEPVVETRLDTAPGADLDAEAEFYAQDDGVRVVVNVKDAQPGKRGVHVHERGDCSDIPGQSMGSHFAPFDQPHGLPGDARLHLGDLGNIEIGADGEGVLEILVPGATLEEGAHNSFAGRALVIHEGEDTGEGASGEAGQPVACGVIAP
jgi:superoxide dismutase, Cu-Zn family